MIEIRETLAVVDDFQFYCVKNLKGKTVGHDRDCLSGLLEVAEMHGWSHVWVMPGTDLTNRCGHTRELEGWNIVSIMSKLGVEFLSARRNEARADSMIYVCFVGHSRWPWEGKLPDAKTLIQTVAMNENALGEPLEWTPAHMSMRVVRRLNQSRWSWWEPMTLDLEKPEYGLNYTNDIAGLLEKLIHWPRKGETERDVPTATYRISIDGNSEYAADMTGLSVGQGNPEWTDNPADYDGKRPGFWKVDVSSWHSLWTGSMLPSFEACKWMTTDMIEQCRRSGMLVEVFCGWYWPKYHQSLRSTAEYLWAMRNNYRDMVDKGPAYQNVYDTIRAIIKAIHGKMGRADTEPHFRRRDVWALVVARAVAMRLYKIEKIYREYGVLPVRIKADEFTYAVTDPHIFDGMLGTAKLGGFKLVECVEIQPVSKVD